MFPFFMGTPAPDPTTTLLGQSGSQKRQHNSNGVIETPLAVECT